jgi:hypothetical protein
MYNVLSRGEGAIVCNLVDGKSDSMERKPSTSNIKNKIGDGRLCGKAKGWKEKP